LGDLSIEGNKLLITIPEKWLSEAAYPVIVDPTIGTNTIGSQTIFINDDGEREKLYLELSMAANRFLMPEAFGGSATAYVYAYDSDYRGRCKPVIYSDNNNVPSTRRSANEGNFDIEIKSGKTAGWRSTTFNITVSITSGTYIWFGLFCDLFAPRFDYGSKCYWEYWDLYGGTDIPNTFPVYAANWYFDFKLSMYFTYSSSQNYLRTITQGVSLSDSKKFSADFKRNLTQSVQANTSITKLQTFKRKLQDLSGILDTKFSGMKFLRLIRENSTIADFIGQSQVFFRVLLENAGIDGEIKTGKIIHRILSDTVKASGYLTRGLHLIVRIFTGLYVRDYLLSRFLVAQSELVLKSCISREIHLDSRIN